MQWFRMWHDAYADPKFAVVAKVAKQPRTAVLAVWWALLDAASVSETRGNTGNADRDVIAQAIDIDVEQVNAIIDAMTQKKLLVDNIVANWNARQPLRPDDISTERVKRHRQSVAKRKVTQVKRGRNASDTDTDAEIPPKAPRKRGALAGFELIEFDAWYAAYPHKVARAAAEAAWSKARGVASVFELTEGLARYVRSRAPDQPWANPATWLNGQRWLDQPAADHGAGKPPRLPAGARPTTTGGNAPPWAHILARYKPGGFWMEANHGARPETDASPGMMRVPRDLLDEWRRAHGLPPYAWKPPPV